MKGNYKQLTESVRHRSNPDNIQLNETFSKSLSATSDNEIDLFVKYAMKPVEAKYTTISKEAGENAKQHLLKKLRDVSFRFQGSVMTNSHIKGYSDIDLLAIAGQFYHCDNEDVDRHLTESHLRVTLTSEHIQRLEAEQKKGKYSGIDLNDLKLARTDSEKTLSSIYVICDTGKPKAIRITNQDLRRDIDVSIANWYDNAKSVINGKGDYRGIQIYNKVEHKRGDVNYPFMSIKRINERGIITGGNLQKMIRFLKTVRAESEENIDLTSFEINAICYDIDVSKYSYKSDIGLVYVIAEQLDSICMNAWHSDKIVSVDGNESIFKNNQKKLDNLKKLMSEIKRIISDLKSPLLHETKSIYR